MASRRPLVQDKSAARQAELPSADQLDPATLGTGTPSATTFLRGDGAWATTATGNPTAVQLGYNCWTAEPATLQSARTSTLNLFYLTALYPRAAVANGASVTVEFYVATAGASLTYGRIGVYSYAGGTATLIGTSADLTTVVTTQGVKTTAITLSQAIAPSDTVYIGNVFVGTTAPALAGTAIVYQHGRGTPFRTGTSTQTTLPASMTVSTGGASSSLFYFALI